MKNDSDSLMDYYLEAVIQLGMLTMFANALAVASLFSIFTNLLEIKIKLESMQKYSRRMRCESANGIGKWIDVMEFLACVCIPINMAIVYFTGTSTWNKVGTSSAI